MFFIPLFHVTLMHFKTKLDYFLCYNLNLQEFHVLQLCPCILKNGFFLYVCKNVEHCFPIGFDIIPLPCALHIIIFGLAVCVFCVSLMFLILFL